MPSGSVYNWLAVAHSTLVILDYALRLQAAIQGNIGNTDRGYPGLAVGNEECVVVMRASKRTRRNSRS
jgi:hypothetical protein